MCVPFLHPYPPPIMHLTLQNLLNHLIRKLPLLIRMRSIHRPNHWIIRIGHLPPAVSAHWPLTSPEYYEGWSIQQSTMIMMPPKVAMLIDRKEEENAIAFDDNVD